MMKKFKYIVVLAAMAVGLPIMAQESGLEPEKVYTHVDTVTQGCTPSSQPYTWKGHSLPRKTGYYYDTVETSSTASKIYYDIHTLHLIVKEYVKADTTVVAACEYEKPFRWINKKDYYNAGKYVDTIKVTDPTKKDTICFLDLTFIKSIETHIQFSLCPGDSVFYHGRSYSKETFDTLYLKNPGGCDSTVYIYVRMKSAAVTMLTQHIQPGESYTWKKSTGDVVLTKVGWYDDSLKNVEGCDSIIRLHLVIDYKDFYRDSSFCEGDTLYYKNNKIYQECVIHDSLLTLHGGDSIIHITFHMRNRPVDRKPFYYCKNDFPLPWPGHEKIMFTGPGLYKDFRPSLVDTICDTIFIADVKEFAPVIIDSIVSLRADKDSLPYVWTDKFGVRHNFFHTKDTVDTLGHTVVDTIPTFHGCDSILMLHVQIVEHFGDTTLQLCPGGEVKVGLQRYTEVGEYEQLLTRSDSSTFSDSILFVHVIPADIHHNDVWDTVTICQSETPYAWHHRKCMTSGEYKDTITAKTYPYCDSIVHLRLTVLPTYKVVTNIYVCTGHKAEFGGKQFELGWYADTVKASNGCDSINILNFIEEKPWFRSDTAYFLAGSTYKWHSHGHEIILTQAGLYHDSCTTAHGCDSIYRLDLREKQSYIFHEKASICANETYRWHNKVLSQTGVYYDSLSTWLGADSIYELNLTVNPTYLIDSVIYACGGSSVVVGTGKKTFTKNGIYRDTLLTSHGLCDSIIVYNIKFIESNVLYKEGHLGKQGSYYWVEADQTLTEPGMYVKSIPSVRFGCDSITYQLLLIKDQDYKFDIDATICSNETYRWHGKDYQDPGNYTWKGVSQYGMDSIENLHLKVNPAKETTININRCKGDNPIISGKTVSISGVYLDTLRTKLGCDSVIKSVVNFYPTFYQCDTITLIKGSSITWHGIDISTSGTYDKHYTTSSICQCDSNYRAVVMLADTFSVIETETICQGDTFYWHGTQYFQAGTYEDRNLTVQGADSTYYLHLMVAPNYADTSYLTLCPGGKTIFFGQTITEAGIYTYSTISSLGCDSSFVLIVNMNELKHSEQYINLCFGQNYPIGDTVFYTSGKYRFTTTTEDGCDSVVDFFIHIEPREYFFPETKSINPGTSYLWHGTEYTKAGVYWDSLTTTTTHCDSVYKLTLTINSTYYFEEKQSICKNETPYEWHGKHLTETGTYYDSLFTKSIGLDSVYCLKLEVRETTLVDKTINACKGEIIEMPDHTKFTSSDIYLDTLWNGGCPQVTRYNINFYRSYHDTTRAWFCEGRSYTWYKHKQDTVITKAGIYEDRHKTVNGCDSIYVLHLNQISLKRIDTTIYVCKEEVPYKHPGEVGEFNDDRDFVDTTISTQTGCDSIIRITRYRLNDKCSNFNLFMRCPNETLYIDERPITADGEYRIPLPGDSVHRFRVESYPDYHFDTFLGDFCDSTTYQGKTYYARSNNDTVRDRRDWTTINGCDSIENVMLVLHRTAEPKTNPQDMYDYAYILFDGIRYQTTGVYTHNLHTSYGCDSLVTLDLRVTPTDHPGSLLLYYCSGVKEDLVVFNKSYHPTQDTLIIDTTRYEGFGMMKIQMANVYVTSPFTITSIEAPDEICAANPTKFNIHYVHKGFYPTQYELSFLPNQLVATPNPQKGEINNKDYIEVEMSGRGICASPGEYPYQLKLTSNLCTISDTTIFGTIVVRYPSSIMESYWDNTVALVNQTYNEGRWNFKPPYNWQIFSANGEDKTARINPNQNLSYISSNMLTPGDNIVVSPLRDGYDKAVPSCEYTFTYTLEDSQIPVLVYPTAVRKSAQVTIESTTSGEYSIFNDMGKKLSDGMFNNSKQNITMPAHEGCYLLYLNPQNTGTQIHKIIVY